MKVEKRRFMQQLEGSVFSEVLGLGYYGAERITQIGFVLSPAREIDELLQQPGQLVLHILHGLPLQNTSWPRIPRGTLG